MDTHNGEEDGQKDRWTLGKHRIMKTGREDLTIGTTQKEIKRRRKNETETEREMKTERKREREKKSKRVSE